MLRSLYIQNYALIEKLDISFEQGFSVITGETGAGKSIILGAIGLLLGQRADVKSIRTGATKCIIEARFDISNYHMQPFFEENELDYEDECILRRELYASGKSRAFINDTPAQLAQMKELGEQLIDIHSQHQNLLLNKEGFQLNVLDLLAHDEPALSAYQAAYTQWKQAQNDLDRLLERAARDKADEDYIRFQWEQLEEAHLTKGEQEELEQEAETLSHAEDIKASLYRTDQLFNNEEGGLLSNLKECCNVMAELQSVYPAAEEWANRLESSYIELKDIADEVSDREEQVEFNPTRLDEVNERLNLIYSLQQKHRMDTVDELMALRDDYATRLASISSSDEEIETLKKTLRGTTKRSAPASCRPDKGPSGSRTRGRTPNGRPSGATRHAQRALCRRHGRAERTGSPRHGHRHIPVLSQQERHPAEHFVGGIGRRDSPRHAFGKSHDSRSGKTAHHRL